MPSLLDNGFHYLDSSDVLVEVIQTEVMVIPRKYYPGVQALRRRDIVEV